MSLMAEVNARDDEKWTRNGIAYLPRPHAAATTRDINDTTTVDTATQAELLKIVNYLPIWHFVQYTASSFGFETIEYIQWAKDWLEAAIFASIEYEFWTGTRAQAITNCPNNYLTNITTHGATTGNITPGATTASNGTAQTIASGLALLQGALRQAGLGGQGMIHCQPQVTPNLLSSRRQGKLLLDQFDNFIVPGAGYPGTGPGGTTPAAGTSWMYATDLVATRIQKVGRVFPSTMAEALDHTQSATTNEITFRAGKMAAATFDGFAQFACLVNLPS
jgi:hypothetical protein